MLVVVRKPTQWRPMLRVFLCGFLMLFSMQSLGALQAHIQTSGLSGQELNVAQSALDDVLKRLPPSYHRFLADVRVEFVISNSRHLGRASRGVIQVNRDLLNLTKPLEINRSSRHADVITNLKATLIHEFSHLYDMANLPDPDMSQFFPVCQFQDETNLRFPECQNLQRRSRTISQNWSFLKASGWWLDTETNQMRQGNFFETRSPDRYEFKSPEESFAVNMEYFLLDPEYKCRKPVLYKNLSRLLNHSPFAGKTCQDFTYQVFVGPWDLSKQNPLTDIPLHRLYEIHWLHAGEGQAAMSRFGHSMLRLVMCAPSRTEVGPECLNDTRYHLVLTYRGSIEESSIDTIKGLRGKYPSILYVNPFTSVINEYTRDEFRNLYSYPLNLSRTDMINLLEAALEAHWSYEGKYYFLSNNCGVETINLLKRGLSEKSPLQKINSIRPDTLVEQLKAAGLFKMADFKMQPPYFFPTKLTDYEAALQELKAKNIIPASAELEKWGSISFETREVWVARAALTQEKPLVGHLHMIETRMAALLTRRVSALVGQRIEKNLQEAETSMETAKDVASLNHYRSLLAQLRSAGHILGNNGYGRPTQKDVDDFFSSQDGKGLATQTEKSTKNSEMLLDQNTDAEMVAALKKTSQLLDKLNEAFGIDPKLKELLEKLKQAQKNTNKS